MSYEKAQSAFDEAGSFIRLKDYSTAIDRLLEAKAYLASVPDTRSHTGVMLTFGRQDIESLLTFCKERERTIGTRETGIQRTTVEYVQPTQTDAFI